MLSIVSMINNYLVERKTKEESTYPPVNIRQTNEQTGRRQLFAKRRERQRFSNKNSCTRTKIPKMNRSTQAIRLFPVSRNHLQNRMCVMTIFTKKPPSDDKKPSGQSPCGKAPSSPCGKAPSPCDAKPAKSPCDAKPPVAQSPCDAKPKNECCRAPTIGINGFGRIGKCLLRLAIRKNINVRARA